MFSNPSCILLLDLVLLLSVFVSLPLDSFLRGQGQSYLTLCLQSLADPTIRNSQQMVRKKNLNFILYLEECYNKMCGLEI